MNTIETQHEQIAAALSGHPGKQMHYQDITDAIAELARTLAATDADEAIWQLGEDSGLSLGELIPAAYWHYVEWHAGQTSPGYAALSALGRVYRPGPFCTGTETMAEDEIKQFLDELAEQEQ